jgi:hypothetical protein
LAVFKRVPRYPHPDGTPESRRRAFEEKYAIDERRLLYECKQGEHARREQLRNHINAIALVFIWCGALVVFAAFIVWAIHLVSPWHFLTPEQLSKLEAIATAVTTTGSIGALIFKYFKDRL